MIRRWWDSLKKFYHKHEKSISLISSILQFIGPLLATTIKQRIVIAALSLSAMGFVGLVSQEDVKTKAYLDGAGVPTIGVGSTKGVKMGDTITVRQALSRAAKEVKDEYEVGFHKYAEGIPLFQHEYDVYLRVIYNIGVHAFSTSTMLDKLRVGDYAGACEAIKRFNKITVKVTDRETGIVTKKKVVSRGLANLREEQYKECMENPNE